MVKVGGWDKGTSRCKSCSLLLAIIPHSCTYEIKENKKKEFWLFVSDSGALNLDLKVIVGQRRSQRWTGGCKTSADSHN